MASLSVAGWLVIVAALTAVAMAQTTPRLVSAASLDGRQVGVCFSEPISGASATHVANYALSGDARIIGAVLRPDGRSVQLEVTNLVGANFTLAVSNLTAASGVPVPGARVEGVVQGLEAVDIGGPNPRGSTFTGEAGGFEVISGGRDIWDNYDEFHFVYAPREGDFDVAAQIPAVTSPNVWSRAGLMAREDLGAGSRHLLAFAAPASGANQYVAIVRSLAGSATGEWGSRPGPVDYPNVFLRLRRVNDRFTAWWGTSRSNWVPWANTIQVLPERLLVGLATSAAAYGNGTTTKANYARYGDFAWPNGRLVITQQPQDAEVLAGESLDLFVGVEAWSGSSRLPEDEVCYQWQRNGTNVPGAVNPTLSMPVATAAEDGARFCCFLRMAGARLTSSNATLSVRPDTTPPQVVYVSGLQAGHRILVSFNETLEPASATNLAHYSVSNGTIVAATLLSDRRTVALAIPEATGSCLALSIVGVPDLAGNVASDPVTFRSQVAPLSRAAPDVRGADSVVTFNEIHYHPGTDATGEFVELYNQMDVNTELDNWRLAGAVNFVFPTNTVLRAGGYLVIAAAPANFGPDTLGPWTGRLSNGGERLLLLNNNDRVMDEIQWRDQEPWPVAADGSGATLAKQEPRSPSAPPENWRASRERGGTPGTANSPIHADLDGPWQNVAFGRPVIAGSGSYPNNPFNVGAPGLDFVAQYVTDGSTADVFSASYWLGREGVLNEHFVLDLQVARRVAMLRLRNTHNAGYNDRSTRDFEVWAATEVNEQNQLVNPVCMLTATLDPVWDQAPITPQYFGPSEGLLVTQARYLEFIARNSWSPNNNLGLNEFSVLEPVGVAAGHLIFSEVAPVNGEPFWVELWNSGLAAVNVAGCVITSSRGSNFTLAVQTLASGEFQVVTSAQLGWTPAPDEKLFLSAADGGILDAVSVARRLRGRETADGLFWHPSQPTPGASNQFAWQRDIVFNEVMYHRAPTFAVTGVTANAEQWLELYNRGAQAVGLAHWRLAGPAQFSFPTNLSLAPGAFLVVANHAAALAARHPNASIVGDFTGKLRPGERVTLLDADDNPAAELRFFAEHPWPWAADAGGSSLELRNPWCDPAPPEAWAASRESDAAPWRHYECDVVATHPVYSPNVYDYHELRLCLLGAGEALLDNVQVVERPIGAARQLVQDPGFDRGGASWRFLGTHRHSFIQSNGAQKVLHLVATGPGDYLLNLVETTFKSGGTIVPIQAGVPYRISFDAQWLSGSPRLRLEFYYNKAAVQTLLALPPSSGTPGGPNSTYSANPGPTFSRPAHSPPVPPPGRPIEVKAEASAREGVTDVALHYRVAEGGWNRVEMTASNRVYAGLIPPQAAGAVVQFYLEGRDALGATGLWPAAGPASRALIKVDDGYAAPGRQNFRMVMTDADAAWLTAPENILSDDRLGATVIVNEREVFYDCGVRLRGSMWSRHDPNVTGFNIEFPGGQPFRGVHPDVTLKRPGNREFLVRQMMHHAGGIPDLYDDLVYLVTPVPGNRGPGRLSLARYEDRWLDSQFENGHEGTRWVLEGIRVFVPQTGSAEDPKTPWPTDFVWDYDLTNLGPDKEQYRWSVPLANGRTRDDYAPIMAACRLFTKTGRDLETNAPSIIDVDQWLRVLALETLAGIGDAYAQGPGGDGAPHNLQFLARPEDGRVLALPWDWDFTFARGVQSQVYPSANVGKLVAQNVVRRAFQGHLLDLVQHAFNSEYLAPWASHFTSLSGEDMVSSLEYIRQRAAFCLAALPGPTAFAITSNDGRDFTTNAAQLVLEGRGWVDLAEIRLAGDESPLPLVWQDSTRWQLTCPLAFGTNRLAFGAYSRAGQLVGSAQITVLNFRATPAVRDVLRLSELHYHPAPPTAAERALSFTNAEDFEFVELINAGAEPVDLAGAAFTAGLDWVFPAFVLAPQHRIVLVKNRAAFAARYGEIGAPVLGNYAGNLANGGERLRLVDANGAIVFDFIYSDRPPWPAEADGAGPTLEVVDPSGDYGSPANWHASAMPGGSPGGPLAQPLVLRLLVVPGGYRLEFPAEPGRSYAVETLAQLGQAAWQVWVEVPPEWRERLVQFTLEPGGDSARFFRVRRR